MEDTEQAAYDAIQAEKDALGIPTEKVEPTEVETPVEPTEPTETTVEEGKEEEPEDPQEVSSKEEKVSPKDFKEYKKELRAEMQGDYDKKVAELREEFAKGKPSEITTENLEDEIKTLASKLELDEEKTRAIIEVARRGLEPLSAEDKQLLADYKADKETRKTEAEDREQRDIFEAEWTGVEKTLRSRFPNATPEQIVAAKKEMDELSHSEKYHQTELDYVLFKEGDKFGKILFSPKQDTFESARPVSFDESEEFPEFNPSMSPAEFDRFQKKREAMLEAMPPEKVKITTRDDRGHVIEREE